MAILKNEVATTIDGKEYTFALNNMVVINIDRKYKKINGGYSKMFSEIINNEGFWDNTVKILSCACTERIDEDFIINNCNPDEFLALNDVINKLIEGYLFWNTVKKGDTKKNQ